MGFGHIPATLTADDIFDALISDNVVDMSFIELLRWTLGGFYQLADHMEARAIGDLAIPWTETVVGAGASAFLVDELPSAVRLSSGGGGGDDIIWESDRTVSLAGLGGQTLKLEARLKISNEANILWRMGLSADTTNTDRIWVMMDTGGAAPRPDGVVYGDRNGVNGVVDANLASGLDLTLYHIYRLEFIPGTSILLYADNVLVASLLVAANVPEDQPFVISMQVMERTGGNRNLDVDYVRVWSE